MSTSPLLTSNMLALMPAGSDNNELVTPAFLTMPQPPQGSLDNGAPAPPLAGTNASDPTQVGDTGSAVASDTTSGFDVNGFFGNLFTAALKGFQVAQAAKPGVGTTVATVQQQQQQQLRVAQVNQQTTTRVLLIVGGVVVAIVIAVLALRH